MKKLLVIGIITLLIGLSVPLNWVIAVDATNESSNVKTLYVGGDGPGNYTKIQDAIDNASDGDTVFVYNGTYYENVVVYKSINLIGENKNSTVIEGNRKFIINISADWVNFSGFKITNGTTNYSGIIIRSDFVTIRDNIVEDNLFGIVIRYSHFNTITNNNIFKSRKSGICLIESSRNTISYNYITNMWDKGILLQYSNYNIINHNTIIVGSVHGISLDFSVMNNFSFNLISKYSCGIFIYYGSCANIFYHNNLIDNNMNAYEMVLTNIIYCNRWNSNYWDDWIGLYFKSMSFLPYRIPWRIRLFSFSFDWNPADKPNDI